VTSSLVGRKSTHAVENEKSGKWKFGDWELNFWWLCPDDDLTLKG